MLYLIGNDPAALWRAALIAGVGMFGGLLAVIGLGLRRNAAGMVVNFAAGAFLALAFVDLLPDAGRSAGWLAAVLATAAGVIMCAWLANWAGGFCPACMVGHAHGGLRLEFGLPLACVVALHSAMDGLVLVGAPPGSAGLDLLSLAVLLHKLPEGMAIAAVSQGAGLKPRAALGLTALIEGCTLPGYLLGRAIGDVGGLLLGLTLGLVAGSFLYLAGLTLAENLPRREALPNRLVALSGALLVLLPQMALWLR